MVSVVDGRVVAATGPGHQRHLVGLDVATLDRRHRHAGGVGASEVGGELAQRQRRGRHGRRSRRHGQLIQVGGHGRRHLRRLVGDVVPLFSGARRRDDSATGLGAAVALIGASPPTRGLTDSADPQPAIGDSPGAPVR